jgi:DNA-binding GntR family transcriptional regulator
VSDRIERVAAPLRVQVTSYIRDAIVSQEFAAGERLIEGVLCERFDVSRTVVREALRQLEAESLVTTIANRGPVVATLSVKDVVDLYEVRAVLEALAGKLFAMRASAAQRKNLQRQLEATKAAMLGGDLSEALTEKDKFYNIILDGAANEIIRADLHGINARVSRLRALTIRETNRIPQSIRELEGIVESAVAGDGQKTWDLCSAHVMAAKAAALGKLRDSSKEAMRTGRVTV